MRLATRSALIVDDESIIVSLIAHTLNNAGFTVKTASDAAGAKEVLKNFEIDIAIIDLHLGQGPNGFDLAYYITEYFPQTKVLALSQYSAPNYVGVGSTKLPEGTNFISKDEVADGPLLVQIVEATLDGVSSDTEFPRGGQLKDLTPVQIEVLRMIAEGSTPAEIARVRKTSISATDQTIGLIYQVLGISDNEIINKRVEAVRIYVENAGFPYRIDD